MQIYDRTKFIPNGFIQAVRKQLRQEVVAHGHDFFEIEFFLRGEGQHIIDGVEYPIQRNALFLLSPASVHAIKGSDIEVITVMFQSEYSGGFFSFPNLSPTHSPAFYFDSNDETMLHSILEEIYKTHRQDSTYAMMLLRCILHKLNTLCTATRKEQLPMTQNIILYMLENFRNEITLKSTAAHFGFSQAYLSEFFMRQTGNHFKAYLDGIRFSHATNLLAFTELPVCEVYTRSGFSDYANFARRFKQKFGVTPTEYRSSIKTQGEL